ncbi:hypothetical protein [Chitinophaga sp. RAB17]|uniref:hypothetical protein n=1 Tax=Chitinophaga sp. RAB17 TaxID=3233049 RepID=UPI003F8E540B
MRVILFMIIAATAFTGCSTTKKDLPAIRPYVFNDSGLHVITTIINEKVGSVAILYGNNAAVGYHTNHLSIHQPAEQYTLVTYREQDNKYWFGSYINGELLSVETVDMHPLVNGQQPAYSIQTYNGNEATKNNAASRTTFITTQDPAWYPGDLPSSI